MLRDDLGIRLPRAMESVIAKNATLMSGISAIGTGFVALGAVEVFARVGLQAYEFYKRLTDVNSEMQKYAVNAANAAQGNLFSGASLGSAKSLAAQTQGEIDRINANRQAAGVSLDGNGSLKQYGRYAVRGAGHAVTSAYNSVVDAITPDQLRGVVGMGVPEIAAPTTYTQSDEKKLIAARQLNEAAQDRVRSQQQSLDLEKQTSAARARTAALTGAAARGSQLRAATDAAALKRRQALENEEAQHQRSVNDYNLAKASGAKDKDLPTIYPTNTNGPEAEYQQALSAAHQQASAENTADARKQRQETERMDADLAATKAQGEARYLAEYNKGQLELQQAHENTLVSDAEFARRRADLEQKYQAERTQRLQKEHDDTAKLQSESLTGGQTGLARLDAEHAARAGEITRQDQAHAFADPTTAAKRQAAEGQRYGQEQSKETDSFTERIQSMDDGRSNSSHERQREDRC